MKAKYPDWVLKYKRKGTAIHKIGNNYYLYKVKSVWDRDLKRARKITEEYLGVITPEGLKEPSYKRNIPTTCKEYGASYYLINENRDILENLRKFFPHFWKEIFVFACLRLMYRCPLKHFSVHYIDSFLSEEFRGVRLSDKFLSEFLRILGADREKIVLYLREFIDGRGGVLIDLTNIFSVSQSMLLNEKGFNSDFDFTPQINMLFIFSLEKNLPLFYRILPGNVRDVRSLRVTIDESGIEDVIIIADKGFYSKENVELLERENLKYILPLKRNNSLINYRAFDSVSKRGFDDYFKFQKRYIWYRKKRIKRGLMLYIFLDERLRVKEEEDYLSRIETHPEEYDRDGFYRNLRKFGTLGILTNIESISAEEVFNYFKSRIFIEQMFDTFKNILNADRTYMRTDKSMEGWMFINYISLIFYYRIYNFLIKNNLLKKYSPMDVLLYLSKIRKVKINKKWITLEIPKKSKNLIEKLKIPIT